MTRTSKPGVALDLAGLPGVPGWLPREEYTWYCDEAFADLRVGAEVTVTGREVDLDRRQVVMSRRWLTPNPYADPRYAVGRVVTCTVTDSTPKGAELCVDRLRGWVFDSQFVRLPWESFDGPAGPRFDAVVVAADAEAGKLTVARWPLVQKRLRERVGATVLRARFVELVRKKEGNEVVGARVELAPGIVAFLPAGEATWKADRGDGSRALEEIGRRAAAAGGAAEVEVVLLPQGPADRDDNLRVSRKRAWAGEYRLAGAPGLFFGAAWANVRAEVAACAGLGPVGVDRVKDAPDGQLLIGGDTRSGFQTLAARLSALAGRTRCTLTPVGPARTGPVALADIGAPAPARRPSAPAPRRAPAAAPPAPPPQGFLGRVWAAVRRLFGG